jgi:hypothetical protein
MKVYIGLETFNLSMVKAGKPHFKNVWIDYIIVKIKFFIKYILYKQIFLTLIFEEKIFKESK